MPYAKTNCVPTCGNFGVAVYDDCSHNNNNNNNNNNNIIGYNNNSYYNNDGLRNGCEGVLEMEQSDFRFGGIIPSPCLQLVGNRHDADDKKLDPYSPLCMVPLPDHMIEPNFIRRRNERERERVRCVNEGYDKLKEHLPIEQKDKRISKVETLRRAIDYIRELQRLLDGSDGK